MSYLILRKMHVPTNRESAVTVVMELKDCLSSLVVTYAKSRESHIWLLDH